jgi:adenylosuccinate synthase
VPGVRTFLSRQVVVHPTALLVESKRLPPDALSRLSIDERARITTPYHQAAGQERARRTGHGSVGVGVGETVLDSIEHPGETITAAELRDPRTLLAKARRVGHRKGIDTIAIENWVEQAASLAPRIGAPALEGPVVFEGAQGVLIDESFGFHPYTTWSNCTAAHALELAPGALKIGVIRSHMVRHGPGPLPTESDGLREWIFDHNRENEWQGPVRYGWFDAPLVRYALEAVGGVDALAVTHLDAAERMPVWKACVRYSQADRLELPRNLSDQERLTEFLRRAEPVYEESRDVVGTIERLLGRRVDIVSRGPCSKDVETRDGSSL